MEKISGIIPTSARISSVDMKEASPIRPGMPSFGRPEGVSSLKEASLPETAKKAAGIQQNMMDWRSKETERAAVAQSISDGFFMKNRQSAGKVIDKEEGANLAAFQAPVSSTPTGFRGHDVNLRSADLIERPSFTNSNDSSSQLKQPEGLYPKGFFIDRTA